VHKIGPLTARGSGASLLATDRLAGANLGLFSRDYDRDMAPALVELGPGQPGFARQRIAHPDFPWIKFQQGQVVVHKKS